MDETFLTLTAALLSDTHRAYGCLQKPCHFSIPYMKEILPVQLLRRNNSNNKAPEFQELLNSLFQAGDFKI